MSIPHLARQGEKKVLFVHDKPFIMLAGELHNSNSSTEVAMRASCEKAAALGMNSVIATLSWEMVEPREGEFDFSSVDMVIGTAREYGLKLEIIWFASWKNAQCSYAPEWVKKNIDRFPRAEMQRGKRLIPAVMTGSTGYSTLSYLGEETCAADARAFNAVMAHIREIDGEENTVLMMQVENETGVLGAAREHSALADSRFAEQAPAELVAYLKAHTDSMAEEVKAAVTAGASSGSWSECFGNCADEIFSAYHVASYVNKVVEAGKAAYDIPMSVNAWLEQGKAGDYPSGGPIARMMEVWQFAAPSVDIFAPDIYVRYFVDVCDEYTKNGNPLFIPETATHAYAAMREIYVVGHHHALCYAPFGYEGIGGVAGVLGFAFGGDNTDPALSTVQPTEQYAEVNALLRQLLPLLGEKYGSADLDAVTSERIERDTVTLGDFGFKFMLRSFRLPPDRPSEPAAGLVLRVSDDTYYVLMANCSFVPFSTDPARPNVDYIDVEEGHFENGKWITTLRRNGDEIASTWASRPTLMRVKLFAYGNCE